MIETLKELVNGKRNTGRRGSQLIDGTQMKRYQKMKRLARSIGSMEAAYPVKPALVQKTRSASSKDSTNRNKAGCFLHARPTLLYVCRCV